MRRIALWPFAWGAGVAAGVCLAALLGPYGPSWGAALAFPVVSLMFSFGSWREDEGEEMTHLLRLTLGFTIGFLACTIPLTLVRIEAMAQVRSEEAATILAEVDRMRAQLLARWAVIALALPGGLATLALRRRRSR